jgi:diguanylate cyclase (GGDEF)-like protein
LHPSPTGHGGSGHDDPLPPEVARVRSRLIALIVATGVLSAVAGAFLVAIVLPGLSYSLAGMGATRLLALLVTVPLAFVIATAGVIRLTSEVLRSARDLAASRSEYGRLYETARNSALEDSLTGLLNHRAFQEEAERQLAALRRDGGPLAMVLIDMDDFKKVNDSGGHMAGDQLLVEFSQQLRHGLRAGDRAFRIGGDEFAILLPGVDAGSAAVGVRRLLAACLEPRTGDRYRSPFSFSAGVAVAGAGSSRDVLYAHADRALYQAKRDGRCGVRVDESGTSPEDDVAIHESVRAAAVLSVLASGGLRPVYQPMIELKTGRVIAFEGLIRPPKDSLFKNASALFEAAAAAGRTVELDLACIAAVLRGSGKIEPDQSISLNLSPRTLESPEFAVGPFLQRLALARWAPERVIVEITERDGIEDLDRIRRIVSQLRTAKVRIAADDVGAGNAGLRMLSEIKFDIVKLDLSLVQDGLRKDTSLAVVRSIADLASRWNAAVVAEGVETPEQLRLIRRLGLTAGQGFLIGAPRAEPLHRRVDLDGLEALAGDEDAPVHSGGFMTA